MTREFPATKHIARKKYTCNACEWISEWIGGYDHLEYSFTYAELREIVKARRNGWQIMSGQEYIRQAQIHEGLFYTWRGLPSIHAICLKYDLYEWI